MGQIIDFQKRDLVIVPLHIKFAKALQMEAVDFKLDTGADASTISKKSLSNIGYNHLWLQQNLITKGESLLANGVVIQVGVVQIPKINILGYEGINWPFLISLDKNTDLKNLLGRDLLAGFDYTFSNTNKHLDITRTLKFVPSTNFIAGQEINMIED